MLNKWVGPELTAQQELRYRQRYLRADINQAIVGVLILMFPLVAFAYNDYRLLGTSSLFYTLILVRSLLFAGTILLVIYLRRLASPSSYDRLMLAWAIASIIVMEFINYTRPPDVFTFGFIDPVVILVYYLIIPAKLGNQTATALPLAVMDMLNLTLTRGPSVQAFLFPMALTYALSLAGSTFGAWQIATHRRREFKLYEEERESGEALKKSLAEVERLSGLIPICAWCKKLRNDSGYWQSVDIYLAEHPGVRLTHGICPDCLQKLENAR